MAGSEGNSLTKMEFAVQMTCQSCVLSIQAALESAKGVESFNINLHDEQVTVETNLPSGLIQQILEQTGRKAILRGHGATQDRSTFHIGAAVAIMSGENNIQGVIRFVQVDNKRCIIDGTIDELQPGAHGLHIHELGDISNGCESLGDHYNPNNCEHGGMFDEEKHIGDLGNIIADKKKRAQFRLESYDVKVWDVIGRSIVVSEHEDDLGRENNPQSKIDGNSGLRLACGIIARSAGLFQNTKKFCACTGMTLWEERDLKKEHPLSQL
ncbi:copper chaperone for superoxide dismutase-like [Dendronephthya gigantea]|uniref:copper chaperone for superoxide dismutase-like n=1 Tax=Dendronephthya gigantea TaxID=151771 RepID=UPI00106B63C5|nr:copper chaperone for superoxide dismutase-like [Dendronephthya gigantea]